MNGRRDESGNSSEAETRAQATVARGRGRYPAYTRGRLERFSRRLARLIHPEVEPVTLMEISAPVGRIPFAQGSALSYRPAAIGETLGPLWASYWVRVSAQIPAAWRGARVELYWDSHSEALLWRDGRSQQGLNPDRHTATLV